MVGSEARNCTSLGNRALTFTFPLPAPAPFLWDAAGGVGVSPARSIAVHCGAQEERGCVNSRNARVSNVRAERTAGTPVVVCARQRERACSVISTLCRMGAASGAAGPPLHLPLPRIWAFSFVGGVGAGKGERERLQFAPARGEQRACREFCRDAWIWGQESQRGASSSGRDEPPDARLSAGLAKFERIWMCHVTCSSFLGRGTLSKVRSGPGPGNFWRTWTWT